MKAENVMEAKKKASRNVLEAALKKIAISDGPWGFPTANGHMTCIEIARAALANKGKE